MTKPRAAPVVPLVACMLLLGACGSGAAVDELAPAYDGGGLSDDGNDRPPVTQADAGPAEDPDVAIDASVPDPVVDAGGPDPSVDAGATEPVVDAGVTEPVVDAGTLPPTPPPPPPPPPNQCTTEACNGIDDDCDGLVDEGCRCPENGPAAGLGENDPLRPIDARGFVLVDNGAWAASAGRIASWPGSEVGIQGVIGALNRNGTKLTGSTRPPVQNFRTGFSWEPGDMTVGYWVPQGLAGSTVGAHKMVAVSWHYDDCAAGQDPHPAGDKGARVSFAEVTDMNAVRYRHVLLVEPTASGFKEVRIHAGGIAWAGSYLYVADTSRGLRVFDVDRIRTATTSGACDDKVGVVGGNSCAFGYSFVLPQVGAFSLPADTGASCKPNFSTLGIDWTTSPPSLLSGEYDSASVFGRLLRWPLNPTTFKLAGAPATQASEAYYMGDRNIQGGVSASGRYWLSATRHCGALFAKGTSGGVTARQFSSGTWAGMSEGVYRASSGNLWTVTEGHFNRGGSCKPPSCGTSPRIVFAVNPAP